MTASPELINPLAYVGGTLLTLLLAAGLRSMVKGRNNNGPKPAGQQSVDFWKLQLREATDMVSEQVSETMKPCFDRQAQIMGDLKDSVGQMTQATQNLLLSSQRRRGGDTDGG